MSMTNGAIRPSGASYREELCLGKFKDNGHKALNNFLVETMGYCIYQEQIMNFLVEFCGFSMSASDTVRRGFSKKTGTEKFLPDIKKGFIKTMQQKYNMSKEKSELILKSFLNVIEDASDYGFSTNHSTPYSCIGYACAWLRYYYPKEFLTVMLNINQDKFEKTSQIVEYAHLKNINVLPIKFRKSREMYSVAEDGIYKGLKSIKYLNNQIAQELYELGKNKYFSFLHLLQDINEKTSINSRQLDILIKLNFFSEFGKNQKLLYFVNFFNELNEKKQVSKKKVDKLKLPHELFKNYSRETEKTYMDFESYKFLKNLWKLIPDKELHIKDQLLAEYEFLGYIETKINVSNNYNFVIDINTKYTPKVKTYCMKDGTYNTFKVYKKIFKNNPIEIGDIIRAKEVKQKGKPRMENGKWIETDEKENILFKYVIIGQNS